MYNENLPQGCSESNIPGESMREQAAERKYEAIIEDDELFKEWLLDSNSNSELLYEWFMADNAGNVLSDRFMAWAKNNKIVMSQWQDYCSEKAYEVEERDWEED